MPHPLWQQIATAAGTPLSCGQLAQLDRYLDVLIEWNERLNLTRIVDRPSAEVRHIADALTLLQFLPSPSECRGKGEPFSLADVGTGSGVPGVPVAVARPDLRITLIDSTKKKLDAIDAMVAAVGVTNVSTLHTRIEAAGRRFDVITARAVSEMANLLAWCEPLMHERSTLLAMKGPKAHEEIGAIPVALRKRFEISVEPVSVAELPGHVIVRVVKKR